MVPLMWEASKTAQTKAILKNGWTPVLAAMAISSMGGKILNVAIQHFPDMASYQPVINGVAGNLVAVHASRIGTSLHKRYSPGVLPPDLEPRRLLSPANTFGTKTWDIENHTQTSRTLVTLVVPGHLMFNALIYILQEPGSTSERSFGFYLLYLGLCLLQVALLLHTSNVLVHWLWKQGIDPDNAAVPYLTALGDLLGGAFLALTFFLAQDWEQGEK